MQSTMQSTIRNNLRNNLRNHSHGFITGAQVHNAFKAQTRNEMLAVSRRRKKTIAKDRHERKPVMSEFIDTEAYISHQIKSVIQMERDGELDDEIDLMILAGDIKGRKRPPTRAEPLIPFLQ